MKAVSSREFNQNVSEAKRLARLEPVFVTDRGKPTHVLVEIDTYRRLSGETDSIVDLLAMSGLDLPEPAPSDQPTAGKRKWRVR